MPNSTPSPLQQLIEAVQASPKYRHIDPRFIRSIGAVELEKRRTLKEALKSTRNKLHQVGAAYQDLTPRYARSLEALRVASLTADLAQLQAVCSDIMSHHASTRERLPLLPSFYSELLAPLAPVHSVLDIACGLNPLAIPWMPLAQEAHYYACDIYQDMMDFLTACFPLLGVDGDATVYNVIQHCPDHKVDVAFILKTIPVLEQVDKDAGRHLLQSISADHLVVSFPSASLSGRHRGMATNYESHFNELVADLPWSIQRYRFASELVFVMHKNTC